MVSGASSFTTAVGFVLRGAGWSRRVVDPEKSEGNAYAAYGMHSQEGRWKPGVRGDFAATTRVLLMVSHGGSRDRVRQAMPTLHGLEGR